MLRDDHLLERESELAAIEDALASDEGALLVVEGAAGLGKTSLAAEARRRAASLGRLVLTAHGAELEREHPFGVVLQLLERPLRTAPEARRESILAGSAGLAAPLLLGTGDGDGEQPLLHGLFWVVQNLAEEEPLAVAVDDAHWSDPSSLRFLLYLAHRVQELPVAIVVAARPGEPAAAPELVALARHRFARRLPLQPLSSVAVARIVRHARPDADPAFVLAATRATGGNPFLLNAVLGAPLSGDAAAAEQLARTAPEEVVSSVLARLEHLGAAAASLARALSVLEDGAPLRRVAGVAGLGLDAACDAATALTATRIINADPELAFVHPLLRTAVRDTMAAHERAVLHGRAARLLHADGVSVDVVAASLLHARAEGDPWAVGVLRRAAARAAKEGAPASAVRLLERALDEPPAETGRTELLVELGRAQAASGDPRGLDRLLEAIDRTPDAAARARISLIFGRVAHPLGRDLDAAGALVRALDDLDEDDRELALELEAEWITVARLELSLRPAAVARLKARARTLNGETPLERVLLALEADRRVLAGEPRDTVLEAARRAWADGALLEEQTSQSWAPASALAAHAWSDDFDTYEAGLLDVLGDVLRRGLVHAHATARYLASFSAYYRGRLVDAAADLQLAVDAYEQGWREFFPAACAQLAWTLIDRGQLDEAERLLSRPELEAMRENVGYVLVSDACGRLALRRGRAAQALEHFLAAGALGRAADIHNPSCVPWRSGGALAAAQAGDRERAEALAREDLALARRFGAPRPIGIALRVTGVLKGGDAGIELLREAVGTLEGSPAELELCRALVDYGAALRRAGHRRDARDPLRRALDMAQRFGAVPLERRARDELLASGGRPRSRMLTGVDSLTPSERRVAMLAADGLTNREIAEALFVTPKAVEWHLRHTYRKLGIPGRGELPAALGNG